MRRRGLTRTITGTMTDPIVVKSAGDEIQAGCTGCPADTHQVIWCLVRSFRSKTIYERHTRLTRYQLSRSRPIERCKECGSVYKMDYIGPPDDPHDHGHHHGYEEPKNMADFVKEEYWYK